MVRAHIQFYGSVQGVGFRYTCLSMAQQLALTGWVKNLPDGSVAAIVEGPREQINELLLKLKGHFGSFIREQKIEWTGHKAEFNHFSIV